MVLWLARQLPQRIGIRAVLLKEPVHRDRRLPRYGRRVIQWTHSVMQGREIVPSVHIAVRRHKGVNRDNIICEGPQMSILKKFINESPLANRGAATIRSKLNRIVGTNLHIAVPKPACRLPKGADRQDRSHHKDRHFFHVVTLFLLFHK